MVLFKFKEKTKGKKKDKIEFKSKKRFNFCSFMRSSNCNSYERHFGERLKKKQSC